MAPALIGSGANPLGILNSVRVAPSTPPTDSTPNSTSIASGRANAGRVLEGRPFGSRPLSPQRKKKEERVAHGKVLHATARHWWERRGRQFPPLPLDPKAEALISEWFPLVNVAGSGIMTSKELAMAFKLAEIPFPEEAIHELIGLIDFDSSSTITWREFHHFVSYAVQAGQDVSTGELVLPSGQALPMGPMIHKLRRKQVLLDITQGGARRDRGVQRAQQYIKTTAALLPSDFKPKPELMPRSLSRSTSLVQHEANGAVQLSRSSSKTQASIRPCGSLRRSAEQDGELLDKIADKLAALEHTSQPRLLQPSMSIREEDSFQGEAQWQAEQGRWPRASAGWEAEARTRSQLPHTDVFPSAFSLESMADARSWVISPRTSVDGASGGMLDPLGDGLRHSAPDLVFSVRVARSLPLGMLQSERSAPRLGVMVGRAGGLRTAKASAGAIHDEPSDIILPPMDGRGSGQHLRGRRVSEVGGRHGLGLSGRQPRSSAPSGSLQPFLEEDGAAEEVWNEARHSAGPGVGARSLATLGAGNATLHSASAFSGLGQGQEPPRTSESSSVMVQQLQNLESKLHVLRRRRSKWHI